MSELERCADWLRQADGLLITAGAGMGIDSGLPDFRGPGGFWAVYPALGKARIAFESIANPAAFASDPRLAWGFYGHRLALYRQTVPHDGFHQLLKITSRMQYRVQVFTSNVDGQFQKAGFPADRIYEVHGSIHHLQCTADCGQSTWSAADFHPEVDTDNCRLLNALPTCPRCGELARPNILMFGDWAWQDKRSHLQHQKLQKWLAAVNRPVCLEIGAGSQVPTVRHFSENCGARLIRLNPGEPDVPNRTEAIGLPLAGLDGIRQLAQALAR